MTDPISGGKRGGILHQPLLHFLILGATLFALWTWLGDRGRSDEKRIVVSTEKVEMLAALWQKQWRRPPLPNELQGLIDSYVREEVLYREALAMGLDREDTVIRRRLAQKIEFLAQDLATQAEPTATELQAFYDENPEIFEEPERITFTHVYVNTDTHGEASGEVAESWLADLRAGADPRRVGDRFMLQSVYLSKSPSEVARHFGNDFAAAVFELEPGDWTGPLRSGYGLHLVRVKERSEAFRRPLEEVRDRVRDELLAFRRREMDEKLFERLSEGYEIVIEEPTPATDATEPRAGA
jgi:hypothetical protein